MENVNGDIINSEIAVEISAEELELINRQALKTLTCNEVFVFRVKLCDNEIDRDFERFDIETLKSLSDLFIGKPGIFDHSMKSRDMSARIYEAHFESDESIKTKSGEPYSFIKASAYMIRTQENAALISEIEAGIKKETSVSCSVSSICCSVCGSDLKTAKCRHIKGKEYDGKLCCGILKNATDAYEWSFVAVPAQPLAGVTKSFDKNNREENSLQDIIKKLGESEDVILTKSDTEQLKSYILKLEKSADDGRIFRNELEQETVRLGLIALPNLGGGVLENICKSIETQQIKELKRAFAQEAEKHIPLSPQLKSKSDIKSENTDYNI